MSEDFTAQGTYKGNESAGPIMPRALKIETVNWPLLAEFPGDIQNTVKNE